MFTAPSPASSSSLSAAARRARAFALIVVVALASSSSQAAVALLPIDTSDLGADGPRVRAALVSALRTTLRDELRPVDEAAVPAGAAAGAADPGCVAHLGAGDDVDEVLFVRADRTTATADVWGRVTLRVYQSRSGRTLTFEAPVSTTSADRDVRALVLRAFEPARYQGRLDIVGVADDDVVVVDGLRAARQSMRLRPGRHAVEVLRPDGSRAATSCDVVLDERTSIDVAPWSLPATTATTTATESGPRPWWPLVTHGALAVASVAGLGVFVVSAADPSITPPRDATLAGGISLAAIAAAATTAAGLEAARVFSASDPTTTNADGDGR
jgi:hypothetical protein